MFSARPYTNFRLLCLISLTLEGIASSRAEDPTQPQPALKTMTATRRAACVEVQRALASEARANAQYHLQSMREQILERRRLRLETKSISL